MWAFALVVAASLSADTTFPVDFFRPEQLVDPRDVRLAPQPPAHGLRGASHVIRHGSPTRSGSPPLYVIDDDALSATEAEITRCLLESGQVVRANGDGSGPTPS